MACRCPDYSQAGIEVGGFNAMTRRMKLRLRQSFMLNLPKWIDNNDKARRVELRLFFSVSLAHIIISLWAILPFLHPSTPLLSSSYLERKLFCFSSFFFSCLYRSPWSQEYHSSPKFLTLELFTICLVQRRRSSSKNLLNRCTYVAFALNICVKCKWDTRYANLFWVAKTRFHLKTHVWDFHTLQGRL